MNSKMLTTTVLLMLLAVLGGCLEQDYCKLCSDHTMCKYQEEPRSFGPQCKSGSRSIMVESHVAEIVDTHNKLRSQVAAWEEIEGSNGRQPGAANMRKMVWDWELAAVAQRWAYQCTFAHDTCRKVERFGVGQNIYMEIVPGKGNRNPDWGTAVKTWYREVKDFDNKNISPYRFSSNPPIDHYSQVVWADSSYVGCGFSEFPHKMGVQSLFICNYGPAGNVTGTEMYKQGKACSQCPRGTVCQDSLCANTSMTSYAESSAVYFVSSYENPTLKPVQMSNKLKTRK